MWGIMPVIIFVKYVGVYIVSKAGAVDTHFRKPSAQMMVVFVVHSLLTSTHQSLIDCCNEFMDVMAC